MRTEKYLQIKSKNIPSGRVYVETENAGNYIKRNEILRVLRGIEKGDWKLEDAIDTLLQ